MSQLGVTLPNCTGWRNGDTWSTWSIRAPNPTRPQRLRILE